VLARSKYNWGFEDFRRFSLYPVMTGSCFDILLIPKRRISEGDGGAALRREKEL
jgi:hypothetical protein